MDIILNKIALWRDCGSQELNKRLSPIGSRYRKENDPTYKISNTPLVRYCKDYKLGKIKYCLFVRTDKEDDKKVEAALDDCAKNLTKEQILEHLSGSQGMEFVYLDKMIGEL